MKTFHRIKTAVGNAILAKYENKCTECGSTENLCVHHVVKMNINDKDYNNIENLIVLCKSCHMSYHRIKGDIIPPSSTGNPYGRRGKIPPIKCSTEGCDNWQHGKGLCKKHYESKRKKDKLLLINININP